MTSSPTMRIPAERVVHSGRPGTGYVAAVVKIFGLFIGGSAVLGLLIAVIKFVS